MKIAVVGASGRTGLQVLERGARRGHEITAVVRNPTKLASLTSTPVAIAQADARDETAQAVALRDADVVVFALGPETTKGADHDILKDGIRTTLGAMKKDGVKRIVAISASGHTKDGDGPLMRYLAKPIVQRFLRDGFADMRVMEAEIQSSGTEWTIMRPPALTDKPGHGKYRSRVTKNTRGFMITRSDLADAILDAVENDEAKGTIISVAN